MTSAADWSSNTHSQFRSKEDWRKTGRALRDGAIRALSEPGNPALWFPESEHGKRVDRLEGLARALLLHSLVTSDCQSDDADAFFVDEICAGLGPDDSVAWPRYVSRSRSDASRQVCVEASAIALSMWISPRVWQALDATVRSKLAAFLVESMEPSLKSTNNWQLFSLPIAGFLLRFTSIDPDRLKCVVSTSLRAAERMYQADGWYSDGGSRTFDYYNAFAFHFYLPVYAFLTRDERLRSRYGTRLARFLPQLELLISAEGSPVFFGRSLTYRFAICAPLGIADLLGVSPEGSIDRRRLIESVYDFYAQRWSLESDRQTVLRGWTQPDATIVESYSGALASYWLAKGFVFMLIPDGGPFWNSASGSLASRSAADEAGWHSKWLPTPGFLVVRSPHDARVALINHGSDRSRGLRVHPADDRQYGRLAYSSTTAPAEVKGVRDNAFTVSAGKHEWTTSRIVASAGRDTWASSDAILRPVSTTDEGRLGRYYHRLLKRVDRVILLPSFLRSRRVSLTAGGWQVHIASFSRSPRQRTVSFGGWAVNDSTSTRLLGIAGFSGPRPETTVVPTALGHRNRIMTYVSGRLPRFESHVFAVATWCGAESIGPGDPPRLRGLIGRKLEIEMPDGGKYGVDLDRRCASRVTLLQPPPTTCSATGSPGIPPGHPSSIHRRGRFASW
ncbi:DUF2264 domain-containing protein [Agromyces larvae]|uniref:DUF2264 domain-containing protein n=1 Tax=Agromyces larvae TaxID=2929802 RepID=UPI00338E66C7